MVATTKKPTKKRKTDDPQWLSERGRKGAATTNGIDSLVRRVVAKAGELTDEHVAELRRLLPPGRGEVSGDDGDETRSDNQGLDPAIAFIRKLQGIAPVPELPAVNPGRRRAMDPDGIDHLVADVMADAAAIGQTVARIALCRTDHSRQGSVDWQGERRSQVEAAALVAQLTPELPEYLGRAIRSVARLDQYAAQVLQRAAEALTDETGEGSE